MRGLPEREDWGRSGWLPVRRPTSGGHPADLQHVFGRVAVPTLLALLAEPAVDDYHRDVLRAFRGWRRGRRNRGWGCCRGRRCRRSLRRSRGARCRCRSWCGGRRVRRNGRWRGRRGFSRRGCRCRHRLGGAGRRRHCDGWLRLRWGGASPCHRQARCAHHEAAYEEGSDPAIRRRPEPEGATSPNQCHKACHERDQAHEPQGGPEPAADGTQQT